MYVLLTINKIELVLGRSTECELILETVLGFLF